MSHIIFIFPNSEVKLRLCTFSEKCKSKLYYTSKKEKVSWKVCFAQDIDFHTLSQGLSLRSKVKLLHNVPMNTLILLKYIWMSQKGEQIENLFYVQDSGSMPTFKFKQGQRSDWWAFRGICYILLHFLFASSCVRLCVWCFLFAYALRWGGRFMLK